MIAAPPAERTHSRSRPMSNLELADRICDVSPGLLELRLRHTQSFGTLVPHVFMGDVLARVGACLDTLRGAGGAERRAEVGAILEILERGMDWGSRETRNVIAMSFACDGELEPFFPDLRPLLGPRLIAQLHGK